MDHIGLRGSGDAVASATWNKWTVVLLLLQIINNKQKCSMHTSSSLLPNFIPGLYTLFLSDALASAIVHWVMTIVFYLSIYTKEKIKCPKNPARIGYSDTDDTDHCEASKGIRLVLGFKINFVSVWGSPSLSLVAQANPCVAVLGFPGVFGAVLVFLACLGFWWACGPSGPLASLWARSWVLGGFP